MKVAFDLPPGLRGPVLVGFAEAITTSAEYEAERGRPRSPSVNLGLAHYLSRPDVSAGARLGAALLAELLGGCPALVVFRTAREAVRKGVWLDLIAEGADVAVSDEPMQ